MCLFQESVRGFAPISVRPEPVEGPVSCKGERLRQAQPERVSGVIGELHVSVVNFM